MIEPGCRSPDRVSMESVTCSMAGSCLASDALILVTHQES